MLGYLQTIINLFNFLKSFLEVIIENCSNAFQYFSAIVFSPVFGALNVYLPSELAAVLTIVGTAIVIRFIWTLGFRG